MRRIVIKGIILLALGLPASAQVASRPKPDSARQMDAFLRTRGDTLWFTVFEVAAPGTKRGPRTPVQAMVVVFKDTTAFLLAGARQVPMPPNMVRIFRGFLGQARSCPRPIAGCKLDEDLLEQVP